MQSSGLVLLCGGDWEPLLGSLLRCLRRPGVATVLRVAWPLLRLVAEPAGASALRHLPAELRSPSCLSLIPDWLRLAILRTGLCGHSERQ